MSVLSFPRVQFKLRWMKSKQKKSFNKIPLLLAMLIIATGQVGVSIYLPALPHISQALNATQADVQLLVTLYLLGFGGSQLFYGPLSDAIGRRPVFILGQGIYLLGTLCCLVFIDNLYLLAFSRLLQGLGAGSASVLGRSVLRDSYDGEHLTKAFSYISVTASILPILAPVAGGWITHEFGWQAVFMFVFVYLTSIFTIGLFILPETLPYAVNRFNLLEVMRNYRRLLGNRQVISSASYNWLSYLASLVSLSVLPFLVQKELGLSAAQYGSVMIIPSAGLMTGSILLNVLSRYMSRQQLLGLVIMLMAMSGCWLLSSEMTLFNLVWAFTWLSVAQGISFPISISMLLEPHKKQAGAVSALSGSIQMGISGLFG
ncbi:MAG TPA: Bcr/CflA family drug resistance efflux transporter, partial [Vibrio sp.]|nr:Bcr/CflA family drug resistance efflux transporter [Vibrio sp.]